MLARPFVKWAGGKTQLLPELRQRYPQIVKKYCEPFVGGGAVLFDVLNRYNPEEILINDINIELINCYRQIRDNTDTLIEVLKSFQAEYWACLMEERKKYYLKQRSRFNELVETYSEADLIFKAALFIFLNKTCFNGLYRVNAKGLFNVPFNNAVHPVICDEENLVACGTALQNVMLKVGDYKHCASFIDADTFVYLDPPYRPLNESSSFTSYSKDGFDDAKQIELGKFIADMANKGAFVIASNSDPKNTDINDNFFDEIYAGFEISRVSASRIINSNAKKRGDVNELLICNVASVV